MHLIAAARARVGAKWFWWIARLSILNSLVSALNQAPNPEPASGVNVDPRAALATISNKKGGPRAARRVV